MTTILTKYCWKEIGKSNINKNQNARNLWYYLVNLPYLSKNLFDDFWIHTVGIKNGEEVWQLKSKYTCNL